MFTEGSFISASRAKLVRWHIPDFPLKWLSLSLSFVCVPEQQLESSLKQFEEHWELNPGDGAFYGPKVRAAERETLCRKQNGEKGIFTFPHTFLTLLLIKSINMLCISYTYTQKNILLTCKFYVFEVFFAQQGCIYLIKIRAAGYWRKMRLN